MATPTNGTAPTRHSGRLIRTLGWLVVAAALFYVVQRLAANYTAFPTFDLTAGRLAIFAICTAAYGVALAALALMWGKLANGGSDTPPPPWQALSIYGRSLLAKYLPGNIFHFAGRQILGHRFGWSQPGMALASILETVLLAAAGMSVCLAYGIFLEDTVFVLISKPVLVAGLAGCLAAPWLIVASAPRVPWLGKMISPDQSGRLLKGPILPLAAGIYLVFFAGMGAVAWLMLGALGLPFDVALLPTVAAGFVAAWLVGYVTPGASGGLGVREASLVLLLGGALGEPSALLLALALRLAMTLGEVLNYAASRLINQAFDQNRS